MVLVGQSLFYVSYIRFSNKTSSVAYNSMNDGL